MTKTQTSRKYAAYKKNSTDKVGYVRAANRPEARKLAAQEFGGTADDYTVLSAR